MALYFMPKYIKTDKNFPFLFPNDAVNLNKLSSLSEQINFLTNLLEMAPEELHKRQAACEEVLQILRKFYPDSSLLIYGSSVNSFGIKGCDMDLLFIPFHNYCSSDIMVDKPEEVTIPDPASILSGEVSNAILAKFNEPSHLKFIRIVLRREKIGKRANFITLQKSPFLKFNLKNYDFSCTISASNKLIAFNSELLQVYGKFDQRVKPLVICLQFWARSLGFIKKSFFPCDSFTLLVIFFLQSVNPPILPSVKHLIEISGFSRMTAGWQTAFRTDVERVPKSENTLTVDELLVQFFDFYFHFDFSHNVVSPHNGRALPIKDIQNSKDERMADFKIKSMNIQDLFILSKNVSGVEKLAVFKLAFLTAYEMLKCDNKMKFPSFFNPDEYQHVLDIHYNRYLSGKPQVCFINFYYDCMQKFNTLQVWYNNMAEAVYDVLQYGLLMECEVTDKVNSIMKKDRTASHSVNGKKDESAINGHNRDFSMHPLKSDKNGKTSTPYDLQLLISIQCLMYSRIYIGRRNVEVKTLNFQNDLEVPADSVLGIEHRISKSLVDKNPSLKSPVPFLIFNCECYRHTNPELRDVIVLLKPLAITKEFNQVSKFLAAFLPEVVKKIITSN